MNPGWAQSLLPHFGFLERYNIKKAGVKTQPGLTEGRDIYFVEKSANDRSADIPIIYSKIGKNRPALVPQRSTYLDPIYHGFSNFLDSRNPYNPI